MIGDTTTTTIVIGLKTLSLVLGGLITYLAFKAYRRTDDRSLGMLSLGFAVVTLGVLLAGVIDQVFDEFIVGLLIESALVAIGFLIILYSLYMTTN